MKTGVLKLRKNKDQMNLNIDFTFKLLDQKKPDSS